MTTKRKVIVSAIALALAGTAAVSWLAYGGSGAGIVAPVAAQAPAQPPVQAGGARPAPAPRALPAMPALPGPTVDDTRKRQAAARAETMLQAEKQAIAAAKGQPAAPASLDAEQYAARDVIVEDDGSEHVRMSRTYRGLPVIGGDLVVHSRDGRFIDATQSLDLQVPDAAALAKAPQPKLSTDGAIDNAAASFDAEITRNPEVSTVYFAKDNQPTLAYAVHLVGRRADGIPQDDNVYIDADDGAFLGRRSDVLTLGAEGTAYTLSRGKVAIDTTKTAEGYVLKDPLRGDGETRDFGNKDVTVVDLVADVEPATSSSAGPAVTEASSKSSAFMDSDNLWGDDQVNLSQRIGAEVHYGVAKTWDYYQQMHDRKGVFDDGKGVRALANIRTLDKGDGKPEYVNAFWYSALKTMVYLNGKAGVSNPVIALDVAGHEMSHGVAAATAALLYSGEAGGINEANSDINGTQVEFSAADTDHPGNYTIGEDVYLDGAPLRYMFKPSLDLSSYKIGDNSYTIKSVDCYPDGGFVYPDPKDKSEKAKVASNDVDPHYTSGVGNHFFYLLSEGAKVPAAYKKTVGPADLVCNGNTKLAGITRTRAGQIWYRALRLYMIETTDYPKAREATQRAAADLLNRGLLSKNDVNTVACAWDAVNVPLPKDSTAAQCVASTKS